MRHALRLGCFLLILTLPGCGGEVLGIGSLVMQGLQMASGGGASSSRAAQTGPFARQNNAQEQQALSDVTSRAVSQSCVGAKDSEAPMAAEVSSPLPRAAVSAPRRCGYQNICLPGNPRPVRMLICEKPSQTTVAAAVQTPQTP